MPSRKDTDPAARVAEATEALRGSLAGLQLALGEDHPVKGCLPLPPLYVPTTAQEMTAYAEQITTTLWEGGVRRADPWIVATSTCPHLPPDGVRAVWEVVSGWTELLYAAADHAEGRKQTFGLAERQASLVARLQDLHTIANRDDPFGPPIDSYSRADALRDGALIQADPQLCREVGYPDIHITLTSNAWADCVAWTDADTDRTGHPQDQTARLRDVLLMAKPAYRQAHAEARHTRQAACAVFSLVRVPRRGPTHLATHVVLRLHFGFGDNGATPVVTIGQPGDD